MVHAGNLTIIRGLRYFQNILGLIFANYPAIFALPAQGQLAPLKVF
jgi:hypothetical protein